MFVTDKVIEPLVVRQKVEVGQNDTVGEVVGVPVKVLEVVEVGQKDCVGDCEALTVTVGECDPDIVFLMLVVAEKQIVNVRDSVLLVVAE